MEEFRQKFQKAYRTACKGKAKIFRRTFYIGSDTYTVYDFVHNLYGVVIIRKNKIKIFEGMVEDVPSNLIKDLCNKARPARPI